MMSKQTAASMMLALALAALSSPATVSGQLTAASPSAVGTANNYTALARGFTAIALNPAGLGMPGNPGFSLTLLPVEAKAGLSGMTLSEIAAYDSQKIPDGVKQEWLQRVTEDGGLEMRGGASATGLALSVGPVGLQVSTVGDARANLSPDAFELLMFGNAGATGTPRDMSLAGTRAAAWGATTGALAFGLPLPVSENGDFAVGATVKYTRGHISGLMADGGSVIQANPFSIDLVVPSLLPADVDVNTLTENNGSGWGMDLGLAWEGSTWGFSAAAQNVFHTFEWDLSNLEYRVGTLTLDGTSITDDFDAVPAAGVASPLRAELLAQTFELAFNVGVAFRPIEKLALTADWRHDTGESLITGERSKIGLGAEFRVIPFLPLRGGISRISGGAVQVGLGLGLELGPVKLSGAYLTEQGGAGEFKAASFALSFGQ